MDEGKGKSSQIFCLTWVKRGNAKLEPDKVILNPDELKRVMNNEPLGEEDEEWEDMEGSSDTDQDKKTNENKEDASEEKSQIEEDDLAEYNMDDYDDEVGDFSSGVTGLVMFSDNSEDPYITKKTKADQISDTESEGEQEEKISVQLRHDDNLLVCARCGQHSSVLEIYVYNHKTEDFYVHHDIPLLETPLCMQWVGFDPGADDLNKGNLLAIGNFNGSIDIWDLDILNTLEPVFSIGKKKLSKKQRKHDFQHSDAVLDLAWTSCLQDQIVSASADTTVALWDLELGKSTHVFRGHTNKVQTIEWRKDSSEQLLSGAFDGRILLLDSRETKCNTEWQVDGEVERVTWNPSDSHYFAGSTDSGMVYYFDVRNPGKYIHNWQAHEGAVPGLILNGISDSVNSNLLFTASSDGVVKIWDMNIKKPKLIHTRNMKIGMVHCSQVNPDEDSVIAFGGQKDNVKLWDICKTSVVAGYLGLNQSDENSNDTLNPLGGGEDDGDDIREYIECADYIKNTKSNNMSQHKGNQNNGANNFGNTKQKKKFANSTKNEQVSDMKPDGQQQKSKKPRKRKSKSKTKMLQKEDSV